MPDPTPSAACTENIDRRSVLAALGAGAAGAVVGAGSASAQTGAGGASEALGWDETRGEYALPPLPYDYDALEPHIDARTMQIHHDRHHAGYVRGLNRALAELAGIRSGSGDASLIQHWSRELSFHGGGHINHTLFWEGMAPPDAGGGGRPRDGLAQAIDASFGSFEAFSTHFKAASGAVEGSGWGWLAYDPVSGRLLVFQMENQQKLLTTGMVPLLGIDVWEHAYYLQYQNRRGDYVEAFMNVINWPTVQRRFERARA